MTVAADVRVSEREARALDALNSYWFGGEAHAAYFQSIASGSGLELSQVRRTVRALARKGLAAYHRGLFTEDGEVAGAGYAITEAGHALAEHLAAQALGRPPEIAS